MSEPSAASGVGTPGATADTASLAGSIHQPRETSK
jgi:hypothetical protein